MIGFLPPLLAHPFLLLILPPLSHFDRILYNPDWLQITTQLRMTLTSDLPTWTLLQLCAWTFIWSGYWVGHDWPHIPHCTHSGHCVLVLVVRSFPSAHSQSWRLLLWVQVPAPSQCLTGSHVFLTGASLSSKHSGSRSIVLNTNHEAAPRNGSGSRVCPIVLKSQIFSYIKRYDNIWT